MTTAERVQAIEALTKLVLESQNPKLQEAAEEKLIKLIAGL